MSEFAGRISRPRPERAGVCDATRPATRTPAGIPYWPPLDLDPYLYFDARNNVSTEGAAVSLWYSQWYGGAGPSNGLSSYLDQGTAEWQPIHSTDGYIQFDNVDTRLEYDSPVGQAGVLICATDNGIFAYEVDADSVDEITALGWEQGYFQTLKLYAMALLPATVSDAQIAGLIHYFEAELGATRNPTGSLQEYWRGRADLVTPKFDALDFSGATDFNSTWQACTSLTSMPKTIDLTAGTDFQYAWSGCTALISLGDLDLSSGTNFDSTWKSCTSLISFPSGMDLSGGLGFKNAWWDSRIENFPALDLSNSITFSTAFGGNASMVSFGSCNMNLGRTFYAAWYTNTALTTFPAGVFDDWAPTSVSNNCFAYAWDYCSSLTATSVENILNSLAAAGVPAPSSGVDITIDYDATSGTPSIATAVATLKGLTPAWTITLNGVAQ